MIYIPGTELGSGEGKGPQRLMISEKEQLVWPSMITSSKDPDQRQERGAGEVGGGST